MLFHHLIISHNSLSMFIRSQLVAIAKSEFHLLFFFSPIYRRNIDLISMTFVFTFTFPEVRAFVSIMEGTSESNRTSYIAIRLALESVIAIYLCSTANVTRNSSLIYNVCVSELCLRSDEKEDETWSSLVYTKMF